jgi:hypothetical protein
LFGAGGEAEVGVIIDPGPGTQIGDTVAAFENDFTVFLNQDGSAGGIGRFQWREDSIDVIGISFAAGER